jgi:polyisoprenoid-binding protein YceI
VHATQPFMEDARLRYVIDTKASSFVVQVFSTGLLSAFAHNPKINIKDFQGSVDFARSGGSIEQAALNFSVRPDSLAVADDVSAKDREEIHMRMRNNVLESDRYPEIVYESSRITASGTGDRYWAALVGNLTLHGVTKNLSISARVAVNGDSLRASGEFSLKQSDFGIALVSAAGGTIRVKDELKFTFDIKAGKQG